MKNKTSRISTLSVFLCLFTIAAFPQQSNAYTYDDATALASSYGSGFGELITIWEVPPIDNPESVANNLIGTSWELSSGENLVELARNEDTFSSDGLSLTSLYGGDIGSSEARVGKWDYTGGTVNFLTVMTSHYVALYGYDPAVMNGGWTTADIAGFIDRPLQGMSHITAYGIGVVPLPAAAPLFASALALYGFIAHRRRKNFTE
jgi:hypothetical protein